MQLYPYRKVTAPGWARAHVFKAENEFTSEDNEVRASTKQALPRQTVKSVTSKGHLCRFQSGDGETGALGGTEKLETVTQSRRATQPAVSDTHPCFPGPWDGPSHVTWAQRAMKGKRKTMGQSQTFAAAGPWLLHLTCVR